MTFMIRRTATAPSDDPKAVFVVGPTGREPRPFIDLTAQSARVGASSGHDMGSGSLDNHLLSSTGKLVIPFDGIDLPEANVASWAVGIKEALAALVTKTLITCTDSSGLLTAEDVRTY